MIITRGSALCGLAAAALVGTAAPVASQELHVDPDAGGVVRFISHTQVDGFQGVTDRIDGYGILDGQPLSSATRGEATKLYFEVDLAALDTGIGLRNRHMRDNYLEVKKYPYASFAGKIAHIEEGEGGALRVTAAGTFSVHGVARDRQIVCDVTPTGASYRTKCAFPVLLSDHDIAIPKVMFLKLANEIRVEVEFTLTPADNGSGAPS